MAKKYIDADKLIHDLEERIFAYSEGYAEGDDSRKDAIETLLKDVRYQCSLQQEQPEVDLEKELEQYARNHPADDAGSYRNLIGIARHFYELGKNSKYMDKIEKVRQEIERRRLHFNKEAEKYQALNKGYSQNCYGARDALRDLENFLDTLSEEPNKSLEEAAEEYRRESYRRNVLPNIDGPTSEYGGSIKEAFIAGGKWKEGQLMKNAKDGWIDEECVIVLNDGTRIDLQPDCEKKPAFEFEYAQDVRIIVLPKEEKK